MPMEEDEWVQLCSCQDMHMIRNAHATRTGMHGMRYLNGAGVEERGHHLLLGSTHGGVQEGHSR